MSFFQQSFYFRRFINARNFPSIAWNIRSKCRYFVRKMLYFKEMEELRSLFEYSRRCPIWMWRIAVVFFFFNLSQIEGPLWNLLWWALLLSPHLSPFLFFSYQLHKTTTAAEKNKKNNKPKCTFHTGVQSFPFQVFLITHFYRSYSKTYSIYIDINVDSIDIIFLKIVGKNSKVAKILLT